MLQKKYKDAIIKKHILSKGKYYKLYLDISNFFHSIYTHTISWEVGTTEKDVFDNLDMLMRTQNNNETKEIIIGPYTSGLFAEIIMSKIDREMLSYIHDNNFDVSYVRYVDDIEMYSDNEQYLESCLSKIEKLLLKYKLDINHNKTSMSEFPFLQIISKNSKSIYQLRERLISNDYEEDLEKIEDIILEINNSLNLGHSNAKYLFNILKNLVKAEDIFGEVDKDIVWILLDYLLNVMFKYQILTEQVSLLILVILEKYQTLDRKLFIEKSITKREAKIDTIKEIIDIWITYLVTKLKEKYDTNWLNASWLSKYWLLFYLNEIKWKLHNIVGFGDTLLAKITLEKLMDDPNLNKRLNLYKIMCDLNI